MSLLFVAKGASFASQNLPPAANTRAKMNATTRSSAEFDMANRVSQIATSASRYSTNDGYSTSDRYSMSSRLSSEVGRSNSGWFQRQAPKNLDMPRASSTSSTASSVAARKHTPVTTKSSISRTDVPDWYRVIESPSDNDRYTTSSLDSDNISSERESFELVYEPSASS
ncbi:uncharacterized protein PITG_17931 [Phytophthora infestans T30-4]|uniref:Uncharacterized protein n=1 Tax=Phytophthora infestans (strain T30-4) TaxID=403677 RepID=D0NXA8_PHYIT|nr:uncharacterized protein PITG_17931 [Phytophthora infestans T30-4]EEY67705.1 conserved hypothetical protein [Phytophthora infestans T30-4]|eukprot:XP_002896258.1 conserved hypothetical protein [Phytophthora infestans T30-4]